MALPEIAPFSDTPATVFAKINAAIDAINGLASDADLTQLSSQLSTAIGAKAAQSALDALTATVGNKASQSAIDALTTAVNGKIAQAALDAAVADILTRLARVNAGLYPYDRPGDNPTSFTAVPGGDPISTTPIDTAVYPIVVVTDGRALQITGSREVWTRRSTPYENGRSILARWRFVRTTNPSDPSDDAITVLVRWFDASGASLGAPQVVATVTGLHVGDPPREVVAVIGAAAGVGVDIVAPPGGVYPQLGIHCYGNEPRTALTDMGTVDVANVRDLVLKYLPPDSLPALSGRIDKEVSDRQSADNALGGRITTLQSAYDALVAGSPDSLNTFLEAFNRFVSDENALSAITQTIANETTRATQAEGVLSATLGTVSDGSILLKAAGDTTARKLASWLADILVLDGLVQPGNAEGYSFSDKYGFVTAAIDGTGVTTVGGFNFANGTSIQPDFDEGLWLRDRYGFMVPVGDVGVAAVDYSAAEIAGRNARRMALNAAFMATLNTTTTPCCFDYNQVVMYGQSLACGEESWPAKTTAVPDVLMIGQSVRPGGNVGYPNQPPLGDTTLRPAVATVQDISNGNLLTPAQVAAIDPANSLGYNGEEMGLLGLQFAAYLANLDAGRVPGVGPKFILCNPSVPGKTIEELMKGSSLNLWSRIGAMLNPVATAAGQAAGSYGIAALEWGQGEWNYAGQDGGATDKASYKANFLKLVSDFIADFATGIAAQALPPAFITYQTSGQFSVDAADMSIGMAQLELARENPGIFMAGPDYPVNDKGGHLQPNGERWLSLQFGKVFYQTVVKRRNWRPCCPERVTVRGRTVLLEYHVPSPPLQFRPCYVGDVATMLADRGFAVVDSQGTIPLATTPTIVGDAVVSLSLSRAPAGAVNVYYGLVANDSGGGNLCDSDPTLWPAATYTYAAGSGDYASANTSQVGRPYPLWNWAVCGKFPATPD